MTAEHDPADRSSVRNATAGLALLMAYYFFFFVDKQIFALLANPIGDDLRLSDSQIGLLQGFAYSVPFSLGGLAAGVAVDRYSRRLLLLGGVLIWSLAAAGSAFATSFAGMAALRAGVGLGESVLLPTAMSILTALFPRERLSMAIGIFYSAASAGGVLAMVAGGSIIYALEGLAVVRIPLLGALQPWQAALLVTAAPGVALAFLAPLIRLSGEGPAARPAIRTQGPGPEVSLSSYVLRHRRFLITYVLGTSLATTCAYALFGWSAAHFGRLFGWNHAAIGLLIGGGLACGGIGNLSWGHIADRLARRGCIDSVYRVYIPLLVAGGLLSVPAFASANPVVCIPALLFVFMVFSGFGPMLSALQIAAPAHLRGKLTGVKLLVSSMIGFGTGPLLPGLLVDFVFRDRLMLGPAVALTIVIAGVAAGLLLLAGRTAYVAAIVEQRGAS